jgi:hypothetical protein
VVRRKLKPPKKALATLLEYLDAQNISHAAFARECKIDPSRFHRILNAEGFPSLWEAVAIEHESKKAVPCILWIES